MQASLQTLLSRGGTAVTATRRLAHELAAQYDRARRDAGDRAWESADVLPWEAWIRRLFENLVESRDGAPALLSPAQVKTVWQGIVIADLRRFRESERPLWNASATAIAAIRSWRTARAWRIDINHSARSPHPDHRSFARWAEAFERRCEEENWIDPDSLAGWLEKHIESRSPDAVARAQLVLAGFDRLTPAQESLLGCLTRSGCTIEQIDSVTADAHRITVERFSDREAQWLAAAHWARQRIDRHPGSRVGLIVPDLQGARVQLERILTAVLEPERSTHPDLDRPLSFHISPGNKLAAAPVAAAAIELLTLMAPGRFTQPSISRLLLSPYLRGADTERNGRLRLEATTRRLLPWQLGLRTLSNRLPGLVGHSAQSPQDRTPILEGTLRDLVARLPEPGKNQSGGAWAREFLDWLETAGWPGERGLDSVAYQASVAARELIRELATVDRVTGAMSAGRALEWVRQRLGEQHFQPQQRDVPVQVMDFAEAGGLEFDALWIADMEDRVWPPAVRIDPFLPATRQRESGLHEASHDRWREHCRRIQAQRIAGCEEVVFSVTMFDGDVPVDASPLLPGTDAADISTGGGRITEDREQQLTALLPQALIQAVTASMEKREDIAGPVLETGSRAAGGVATLADQASCPFRAYARHRLAARAPEARQPGFSPRDRGILVHRVLENIWRALGSRRALLALEADDLQSVVARDLAGPLDQFQREAGSGRSEARVIGLWLRDTVQAWLAVEATRNDDFEVEGFELEEHLELGGLELVFRLDRVDRLDDGGVVLIDYKTGKPESVLKWTGGRPSAPQLPLYALTRQDTVDALVFAHVREGESRFVGVSREVALAPRQAPPLEDHGQLKDHYTGWQEMLDEWRRVLASLAEDHRLGRAEVNPLHATVCDRCDLQGLCRVQRVDTVAGESHS